MSFEQRKAATLESLTSSVTDKSPKGTLDEPIVSLINVINSHPDYFTTSSCSGRVSIFSHPTNRPKGGSWLYITNDLADADAILSLLFPAADPTRRDQLVFRLEPLIVAVECRDVELAQHLVSLAVASGLRESGVTSVKKRVIVGMRCSIRLEVPFGESGDILVSKDYVRFLVGLANEKMEANRKRTDGFFQALVSSDGFFASPVIGLIGENANEDVDLKNVDGPAGVPSCSLNITQMAISGEPVEKLFLWGHSACT